MFTNKRFLTIAQIFLIGLFSIISIHGAAGDVDANFNPSLTKDVTSNFSGNPVLQPDGKIIVYGNFQNNSGGLTSTYIKRLNSDGTTDTSFNCAACIGFFCEQCIGAK